MSSVTCKACGKGFENGESACPHCGTKAPSGFLKTGCVGMFVFFVLVAAIGSTKAPDGGSRGVQSTSAESPSATVSNEQKPINWEIKADEIGPYFVIGTRHTQIQVENITKKIIGEKVCWKAPIYEVSRDGNGYRVQFKVGNNYCGAVAFVPGNKNSEFIESLVEGQRAVAVGTIQDVSMRTVIIQDAEIIKPDDMERLKSRDAFLEDLNTYRGQPIEITLNEVTSTESFKGKIVAAKVDGIEAYDSAYTPSCAKRYLGKSLDRFHVTLEVPIEDAPEFDKYLGKSIQVYGRFKKGGNFDFSLSPCWIQKSEQSKGN